MNDFLGQIESEKGPIEYLGQTFPSDDARREHFLKLLAETLKDPELRHQEGFTRATDEAILAMSDLRSPYDTACPNPWSGDFVVCYGKPYDPSESYSREPLAVEACHGVLTDGASEKTIDDYAAQRRHYAASHRSRDQP